MLDLLIIYYAPDDDEGGSLADKLHQQNQDDSKGGSMVDKLRQKVESVSKKDEEEAGDLAASVRKIQSQAQRHLAESEDEIGASGRLEDNQGLADKDERHAPSGGDQAVSMADKLRQQKAQQPDEEADSEPQSLADKLRQQKNEQDDEPDDDNSGGSLADRLRGRDND